MAKMDESLTHIAGGIAGAKVIQALMRVYGDKWVAQMWSYTPEQYVKDLKTTGYVVQTVDAAKSDADIGEIVKQTSGYTFASGPGGLRGSARLTADPYTYQAAMGQKIDAWKNPSGWASGVLGLLGIGESQYNWTGNKEYSDLFAAAGASLLGDGIVRAMRVDGTITAPSGFDVSKQPAYQYLDQGAIANLNRLSADNSNLKNEIMQLRAAQPPRGIPSGVGSYGNPVVQVSEILPGKGAEAIKQRTYMMGGIQKATPEEIKRKTGLVTLTGGRN